MIHSDNRLLFLFTRDRYFCSHNTGIHMVSMPMVSQLEEYTNIVDGKEIIEKELYFFCYH